MLNVASAHSLFCSGFNLSFVKSRVKQTGVKVDKALTEEEYKHAVLTLDSIDPTRAQYYAMNY